MTRSTVTIASSRSILSALTPGSLIAPDHHHHQQHQHQQHQHQHHLEDSQIDDTMYEVVRRAELTGGEGSSSSSGRATRDDYRDAAALARAIANSKATAALEARRRGSVASGSGSTAVPALTATPAIPAPHAADGATPRYTADEAVARALARSWRVESLQSTLLASPSYTRDGPSGPSIPAPAPTRSPSHPPSSSAPASSSFAQGAATQVAGTPRSAKPTSSKSAQQASSVDAGNRVRPSRSPPPAAVLNHALVGPSSSHQAAATKTVKPLPASSSRVAESGTQPRVTRPTNPLPPSAPPIRIPAAQTSTPDVARHRPPPPPPPSPVAASSARDIPHMSSSMMMKTPAHQTVSAPSSTSAGSSLGSPPLNRSQRPTTAPQAQAPPFAKAPSSGGTRLEKDPRWGPSIGYSGAEPAGLPLKQTILPGVEFLETRILFTAGAGCSKCGTPIVPSRPTATTIPVCICVPPA